MRYTIRQTSKCTPPHRQTDERIPKAEWREQTLEDRRRSETFNVLKHIRSKEELTGHERCRLKRPWVIEVNAHGLQKEDDST